jgi:hypothetical protein
MKTNLLIVSVFLVLVVILVAVFVTNQNAVDLTLGENSKSANSSAKVGIENAISEDEKCIIEISGQKYDVSKLKNTHSGGNIFRCGSDMSVEFQKQHRMNLEMIEKYKI